MLSRSLAVNRVKGSGLVRGESSHVRRAIVAAALPSHGGLVSSNTSPFSSQLRSLATSTSVETNDEYDIDLISMKRTRKVKLKVTSKESAPLPKAVNPKIISHSINQVKQDPVDYKGYKKTGEQGYLEFVGTYQVELDQFLDFIKQSYKNKISRFEQLTALECANSAYIFKDLFMKGKLDPPVNKYNMQSYLKMVNRLIKYLNHDPNFPSILSNQLLPFAEQEKHLTQLYSQGILNFLPELTHLDQSLKFTHQQKADINEVFNRIHQQITKLSKSLKQAKKSENFDASFFQKFIELHRWQRLETILASNPDSKPIHLSLIVKDGDSSRINNRIKRNSGEDTQLLQTLQSLAGGISLALSQVKYDSFPQLFATLYVAASQSQDHQSSQIYSDVVEKLLPLLSDGTIGMNDHEILNSVALPNLNKPLVISNVPRENFELKQVVNSGLGNYLPLLQAFRGYCEDSFTDRPAGEVSQDLAQFVEDKTTLSTTPDTVSQKIYDFGNALYDYLEVINWSQSTLEKLVQSPGWQSALVWFASQDSTLIDEDGLESSDYRKYVETYQLPAVSFDEEFLTFQSELKRVQHKYFADLPFACFTTAEIKDVLSNILPSSVKLSQLINSLPTGNPAMNANYLDEVLSSPAKPANSTYTQVPDELELDKFTGELTALTRNVFKKPFKDLTAEDVNRKLDEAITQTLRSKHDDSSASPKVFRPTNAKSIDEGIHRGNVYNYIRLSKRLTKLFESNGGNTAVLDFLIHSQSVLNAVESKIKEKKSMKKKDTTDETSSASNVPQTQPDATPNNASVKPCVQIPDDLELHTFTKELEILKNDELKASFKNFSAEKINSLLDKRIDQVQKDLPNTNPASRLSKENVFEFIRLSKRLTRLFAINGGNTAVLDTLLHSQAVLSDVESKIAEKKKQKLATAEDQSQEKEYVQIPDDLELHNFTKELEIVKNDELKAGFHNFSAEKILSLLDARINQIYNDLPNTNPVSRLNKENVYDFMRLSKRLTRLFSINGGNTAILDTVIHNQSVLSSVEKKIADKKVSEQTQQQSQKQQPTSKAYVQIPDDLELHKFSEELKIFKNDELKSSYKNFTSEKINKLLDKRINEVQNDLPNTNPASRLNKTNVYEFMRLSKRLTRLFSINGDNTAILDTVIQSSSVFDDIEAKILSKKSQSQNSSAAVTANESRNRDSVDGMPYRQVPDDFLLEEYTSELIQLRTVLGQDFKSFDSETITRQLYDMAHNEKKYNLDKRIAFSKLYRNLVSLFKHNGQQSFILDNILINAQVYADFETSNASKKVRTIVADEIASQPEEYSAAEEIGISSKSSPAVSSYKERLSIPTHEEYTNKFNMDDFINQEPNRKNQQEYNDSEYILSLLSRNNDPAELENNDLLKSELAIKDAVATALNNKHEAKLYEENPEEFNDLVNLTAEKVRENHRKRHTSDSNKSAATNAGSDTKIDKSSLESFLQNAKKEKDLAKERKFRETKAYEWSKSMCNSHRSLESHNFFNPLLPISIGSRRSSDLFFPGESQVKHDKHAKVQYLLLTQTGQKILSNENPLGVNRISEDMFTIFNRFDKKDLNKFLKNVKKLQNKDWKLIGGGGKEKMLVFTRIRPNRRKLFLTKMKTILATAGAVFLTLLGLNYWSGSFTERRLQKDPKTEGPDTSLSGQPLPRLTSSELPLSASGPLHDVGLSEKPKSAQEGPVDAKKSTWQGLFWKKD